MNKTNVLGAADRLEPGMKAEDSAKMDKRGDRTEDECRLSMTLLLWDFYIL